MKRKTIGIIVAVLVLAFAGGIGWNLRGLPQKQLLNAAENMVFTDADSTERLLALCREVATNNYNLSIILLRIIILVPVFPTRLSYESFHNSISFLQIASFRPYFKTELRYMCIALLKNVYRTCIALLSNYVEIKELRRM